jgi:hypothetical protein
MKSKKLKQRLKKKKESKHKKPEISPQISQFRKKAPRKKVAIEISINSQAFKGKYSEFKLFSP